MYTVYAISSLTKNYIYVGLTDNILRRFTQHNQGWVKTTRSYKPFKLLYTENVPNRISARAREKYLKSGIGKEFLKSLLIRPSGGMADTNDSKSFA
ncbi:MAG: GIY-YIG nuclease family protein [Candidatus Doudnabacteria bacterium]|nr:GIY-YIG nuclease family protein [Candidatus Doudnabacteria bacterium]